MDIEVKGIEQLKKVFNLSKSKKYNFKLMYGNAMVPVVSIEDENLIINFSGKNKVFPYSYIADDWGEIFAFFISSNSDEVMIDFSFTDEEKEKFNKPNPEQLAKQDFSDIASEDELELNEGM